MRKVILFIASSLDCFIARKNGDVSWLFMDSDYGYKKFYNSIDTVLMGRKTYETAKKFEKVPYKEKKCFVFSRMQMKNNGNVDFVKNPVQFTKSILKQKGKNIWLGGGAEIISLFLNNKLIDEIVISMHPIILGNGIHLFKCIKKDVKLNLISKKIYKNGLVQLKYKVL